MKQTPVTAIYLLAGSGFRFNSELPKQFIVMKGLPLFIHAAKRLASSPLINQIVFVCPKGQTKKAEEMVKEAALTGNFIFMEGGASREDSCLLALAKLAQDGYKEDKPVIICDADRPNLQERYIQENIDNANKMGASVTAIASSDSVAISKLPSLIDGYIPRQEVVLLQTPQAFRFSLIYKALSLAKEKGLSYTDEGSAVLSLLKIAPAIVNGDKSNIKITTREDEETFIRS